MKVSILCLLDWPGRAASVEEESKPVIVERQEEVLEQVAEVKKQDKARSRKRGQLGRRCWPLVGQNESSRDEGCDCIFIG